MTVWQLLARFEAEAQARAADGKSVPPPPLMPWPGKFIGAAIVWVRPKGAS